MLTFLAALTASEAKKPDSQPGTLMRAEIIKIITDSVVIWLWGDVSHFDEPLSLFDCWFKTKTCVENGDILVDSFQQDADTDFEFSSLDFLINQSSGSERIATTNQINLIDASFDQIIHNLVNMEWCFFQSQEASTMMMDRFNHVRLKLDDGRRVLLIFIVSFEGILDSEDFVDIVDLLEHANEFSDDSVDAGTELSADNDVSTDLQRVEELSVTWACTHVLLFVLELLACTEDAIFDQKCTWLDDGLRLQKWFLLVLFWLMCDDRTGVCFNFGQFQIYDEVRNPFKIAHGSGHQIKFFFQTVFWIIVLVKFQIAPLFIKLLDLVSPVFIGLISLLNESMRIEWFLLCFFRFNQEFLYQVIDSER